MNPQTRNRILLALVALAGTVSAGVGIVRSSLEDSKPIFVRCDGVDGGPSNDCILLATPRPAECPALLRRGGDNLGPIVPDAELDAALAAATAAGRVGDVAGYSDTDSSDRLGRVLVKLAEAGAIRSWHTDALDDVDGGVIPRQQHRCALQAPMSGEQAEAWRLILEGKSVDGGPDPSLVEAVGVAVTGAVPAVRNAWEGQGLLSAVFSLSPNVDAGPPPVDAGPTPPPVVVINSVSFATLLIANVNVSVTGAAGVPSFSTTPSGLAGVCVSLGGNVYNCVVVRNIAQPRGQTVTVSATGPGGTTTATQAITYPLVL